jgi:sulfatase maturation enzyme AslB (radical SAM superfamily)
MSKTFCPVPWNFQAIRANGDIRVCCQANVTKNQGVIRKPDGTAFNAGKDSLSDARNTDMMKAIRINMLNGEWSDECGRCKNEEASGLVSRRTYENEQWKLDFDYVKSKTNNDGSIDTGDFPVVYYDLRFGNFCNLKCRMCGPTDSSAWYDDWIKLTGTNKFKDTSGIMEIVDDKVAAFNWPEYEPFWEQLEANIHNIEHVYFAGGEPMLIERHYDFLERCVEAGAAKHIIVEYNTNMSTLPTRVTNLWKSFKQVRVGASVDGMEAVQEYQRSPAKWDKTLDNLRKVDALPSNIVSWLAFTVTAYNVNHMIDFMKWKLSGSNLKRVNSTNRRPIITHHVAHHPKHLNVRVLPEEYKKDVTNRFNEFLQWVKDNNYNEHVVKQAEDIVKGVTSYMNSESYYDSHWNEFIKYTRQLDSIRNENLLDVEPKFKDYING